MSALDIIDGGDGTDTLSVSDDGDSAFTMPAVQTSSVENIELKNINGNSDGSTESAIVTFGDLKAGQYVEVGGIKVLATADLSASDVASAAAGVSVTDATVSGTLDTDYDDGGNASNPTAGPNNDQVTFTSESVGNLADLTLSGNALTDQPQTNVITVATAAAGSAGSDDFQITFNVNGTTVLTNVLADDASAAVQAAAIADALNAFVGSKVATFADQGNATDATVQIVSDEGLSISNFGTAAGPTIGTALAVTNAAGGSKYTMDISTGTAAADGEKVEFFLNGEEVVSEAVTANTDAATATAIVEAINTAYGAVIASKDGSNDITVDTGGVGIALSGFEGDGSTYVDATLVNAIAGSGRFSTDAPTISVTDGVDATTDGFEDTLDASLFADGERFVSDVSTSDVAFTNLSEGQIAEIRGNAILTNGNTSVGYDALAESAAIEFTDGTKGSSNVTVTGAALTSGTVNSNGAANTTGTLDLAGVTTATITADSDLTVSSIATAGSNAELAVNGAGDVSIGTLDADIDTVTAGTLTGALTMTLDAEDDTSVTTGSGNDVITTGAALNTGSVDAGAGTDTLVLGANGHADTEEEGGKFSNFETLRATGTFDASLVDGITAIEIEDASTISNLSATQAGNVAVLADATGGTTFALEDATGTSDVLGLSMGTGAADASEATDFDAALVANGFETINLETNAGAKANTDALKTTEIASFTADSVTSINLSGAAFNLANAATTKAVAIDASALTDGLTIAGNLVADSSVTGSDAVDDVTLGTASNATYSLGAGKDTISGTVAQIHTGSNYSIIDGGAGTDTLTISDGAASAVTMTDADFKNITNVEEIVVTDTTTAATSITTGGFYDNNFKDSGAKLTTSTTTGDITVDMQTFTGNATITATEVGSSGSEGAIVITTGSGDDVVTVNTTAAGDDDTVSTGLGDDKITTAGDDAVSVTGGAGNDELVFGSTGVNTAVFESSAALNGSDTITGFDKASDLINQTQADAETTVNGALTTNANNFYQLGGQAAGAADSLAASATALSEAAVWTGADVTAFVAVSDDNSTAIYQLDDTAASEDEIAASELTLMGTIDAAMSTGELNTAITIA